MDLSFLNPEQRLAAETLEGPLLILAGAGSGKTRALTARAANLIDHGVPAWQLLCLTFTNKAAKEMKERIIQLAGQAADEAWISTFHSACARILRRDIEKLGYTRSFAIYDDDDQARLLKELLKQLNIDEKYLPVKELLAKFSDAKNKLLSPDEWFSKSPRDRRSQQIHEVYSAYEKRLRELNALDFDDLLLKTLELMAEHPPVLDSYRQRFHYVMVDEYQDTNYAQYMLVKLLTATSRNLCVVGDDDQSIYGWRGADIRNILDFEKDYPDATVIKLEQNYRSTANILDAANQVIAFNEERKEKELWTEDEPGEPICLFTATDERAEAAWVVSKILTLHAAGESYSDMAVLYRNNSLSRSLEEMLNHKGIPYRIYGGMRFYERKEIRDIVSYLRVLCNPSDDLSLVRIINVPKRAIGDSTVQELQRYARDCEMPLFSSLSDLPDTLSSRPRKCVSDFFQLMTMLMALKETLPLVEFVPKLIELTGLEEQYQKQDSEEAQNRIDNIHELVSAVTLYARDNPGAKLEDWLENIALVSEIDSMQEGSGILNLMTLHSSKGLEFNNVFITAMEEGIFPSSRAEGEGRLQEERRLCYVGITRARKRLFLSKTVTRMFYNQPNHNEPSRFLDEIPKRLIRDESAAVDSKFHASPSAARQRRTPYQPSMTRPGQPLSIPGVTKGFVQSPARSLKVELPAPAFKPGDRVMHRKFGEGKVMSITGAGAAARINIQFITYGEKEFALSIAPIVKIEE